MIRLHPDPFTVSNLRHHRRQRTFVIMLALAGTVACGGEDPTGPRSPELAAPAKQWTVPTVASLLSQTQVEVDAVRAAIERQRVSNNEVAYMFYVDEYTESQDQWFPAPTDAPPPTEPPPYEPPPPTCTNIIDGCAAYSVQLSGYAPPLARARGVARETGLPPARMLGARVPIKPKFLYDTESWDCKALHDQMRYYSTKFRGNYKLFWFQTLTGQYYQNFLPGGTVDAMEYYTRQMSFTYWAYRDHGCSRPPRGGSSLPLQ